MFTLVNGFQIDSENDSEFIIGFHGIGNMLYRILIEGKRNFKYLYQNTYLER